MKAPTPQSGRAHYDCRVRSEEHTSELQSQSNLVCRLLLEKKTTTPSGHREWRVRPPTRASSFATRTLNNTSHTTLLPPPGWTTLPPGHTLRAPSRRTARV